MLQVFVVPFSRRVQYPKRHHAVFVALSAFPNDWEDGGSDLRGRALGSDAGFTHWGLLLLMLLLRRRRAALTLAFQAFLQQIRTNELSWPDAAAGVSALSFLKRAAALSGSDQNQPWSSEGVPLNARTAPAMSEVSNHCSVPKNGDSCCFWSKGF